MNTVPLVKGEITFEQDAPSFSGAVMHVYLENITVADMASEVVAECVERDVAFDSKVAKGLLFSMAGTAVDSRASYAVRVHIDIDGDGQVTPGDFISTQSYPVITFGYPGEISIRVRQVK